MGASDCVSRVPQVCQYFQDVSRRAKPIGLSVYPTLFIPRNHCQEDHV